jgi:hypothetical protein
MRYLIVQDTPGGRSALIVDHGKTAKTKLREWVAAAEQFGHKATEITEWTVIVPEFNCIVMAIPLCEVPGWHSSDLRDALKEVAA